MEYLIRKMEVDEYPLLKDFLYEAIFQRDETNLLPRTIINEPSLKVYIEDFGKKKDDYCLCVEVDTKVVGAVWIRSIDGYGIGTEMMKRMSAYLIQAGYSNASLAVQKDNYAFKVYLNVGFQIIDKNEEEYIMVHYLE